MKGVAECELGPDPRTHRCFTQVSVLQEHHHLRPRDETKQEPPASTRPQGSRPSPLWWAPSLSLPAQSLQQPCPLPAHPCHSPVPPVGLWGGAPVCFPLFALGKSQPVLCLVYNWFGDSSCPSPLQSLRGAGWPGGDTLSCAPPAASVPAPLALARCCLSQLPLPARGQLTGAAGLWASEASWHCPRVF